MSDEEERGRRPEDAELEREIRSGRKFSLAEAIGRAAGDLMKGASPVTQRRQAEAEIEQYLEERLADAEGALAVVLKRRVLDSEALLEEGYDRPLAQMTRFTEELLRSDGGLHRFVDEVDAEWGRMYSERPYFQTGDAAPRPGDPYTVESVRSSLAGLLDELRRGPGAAEARHVGGPAGDREPREDGSS